MLGCGCMPDLIEARPRTTVTQEHAMATGRTWSNSSLAHRLTSGGTRRSARLGTQLLPAYASSARRSTSKRTRLFPMPAAHLRQGPTAQPLAAPPNQTTCGAPTPRHPPSTHARTHARTPVEPLTCHRTPYHATRTHTAPILGKAAGGAAPRRSASSTRAEAALAVARRASRWHSSRSYSPRLRRRPSSQRSLSAKSSLLPRHRPTPSAQGIPVVPPWHGLAPAAAAGPTAPPPPRHCAALLGPKDRRLHRRKPKRAGCGVHGERGAGVPSST